MNIKGEKNVPKGFKEPKGSKEIKEPKEPNEPKGPNETSTNELKGTKEPNVTKGPNGPKEPNETSTKEPKGTNEIKEPKEPIESFESKGTKESKGPKESKGKDLKDSNGTIGSKGSRAHPKPALKKTPTMDSLQAPIPNQSEDEEAPKVDNNTNKVAPKTNNRAPNTNNCYKNYVLFFSVLFVSTAIFVMIGYYTIFKYEVDSKVSWDQNFTPYSDPYNYSAHGICPHLMIKGDGFCDDEANIELCDYDDLDCCNLELDRSLCSECFCYGPLIEDSSDCFNIIINPEIGDGHCNPELNKLEFYFDAGDCCLGNVTRKVIIKDAYIPRPCFEPDCICIPSYGYAYCIADQLGDGICQDYNNVPQCDHDHGDCCTPNPDLNCCLCCCKALNLFLNFIG